LKVREQNRKIRVFILKHEYKEAASHILGNQIGILVNFKDIIIIIMKLIENKYKSKNNVESYNINYKYRKAASK
jgi:hypothetical protein